MSADARREFVDANILVYAFDASAGDKHTVAAALLARLWENGGGCLSVQVLQEFFVVITRKVPKPLSSDEAADRIRDFEAWDVFTPTIDDVLSAIALHTKANLSFWDAMIVEAAAEAGCEMLWSEDLTHGRQLRGVRIQNPFRDAT
jgi:predicted nucleic acid-binding protein